MHARNQRPCKNFESRADAKSFLENEKKSRFFFNQKLPNRSQHHTKTSISPVDLRWVFEISIRTEKKILLELKKIFSYKLTEILSQFEIIAEMDILKNQWRSTGG